VSLYVLCGGLDGSNSFHGGIMNGCSDRNKSLVETTKKHKEKVVSKLLKSQGY